MGRRYRRRSSPNEIISDTVFIGSRLPWWGALLFGILTFVIFYFIIPAWLDSKLASQPDNIFHPMLEAVFGRRIHWSERIGIACGLVGLFFCIRNYILLSRAGYQERGLVGILARMFGRDLS